MATPMKLEVNAEVVAELGRRFATAAGKATFDPESFGSTINATLESRELKDRINLIADTIRSSLALDYPQALEVVVAVAETGLDPFASWPLSSFVERYGVENPTESLAAMPILTQHWTCEFAIRPFLDHHLDQTLDNCRRWAVSSNADVRRLPSEGLRPLLPWGPKVQALTDDPFIGLELLEVLRHDESEMVRRSVANHLNDVAKAHPDLVVSTLERWSNETPPVSSQMVRHALRTLVKQGNPGAMSLLGFATEPDLVVESFTCTPAALTEGSSVELSAEFRSTGATDQKLVVDFVVHHQNANGATSPKVFKWTTITLAPDEATTLTKKRPIKHVSTRTYHAGTHRVELQVAGQVVAETRFELSI